MPTSIILEIYDNDPNQLLGITVRDWDNREKYVINFNSKRRGEKELSVEIIIDPPKLNGVIKTLRLMADFLEDKQ